MINRTRRRDIGAFTIRKPETVTVAFTPSQQRLHDELIQVQAEIFRRLHGDVNVEFMMTTIRRQAASCLYGLAPFLEDILNPPYRRIGMGGKPTIRGPRNSRAMPSIPFTGKSEPFSRKRDLSIPAIQNSTRFAKSFGTSKACPTTR